MEHARPPAELCLEGGPVSRAESWQKWLQRFKVFLNASGVDKESNDVKASLLVNLVGSEGYDVYTTIKLTKDENKECFDTLVQKYNDYFETKQNTTMARFKFFTRNQDEGDSIDDYVTALKIMTQRCEFEYLEEGLVRDRIVCGVRDGKLRDRLLRADDLTLAKAVKVCQASEMSKEEQMEIEGTKTQAVSVDEMYSCGEHRAGTSGGGEAARRGAGGAAWRGGRVVGGGPAPCSTSGGRQRSADGGGWPPQHSCVIANRLPGSLAGLQTLFMIDLKQTLQNVKLKSQEL